MSYYYEDDDYRSSKSPTDPHAAEDYDYTATHYETRDYDRRCENSEKYDTRKQAEYRIDSPPASGPASGEPGPSRPARAYLGTFGSGGGRSASSKSGGSRPASSGSSTGRAGRSGPFAPRGSQPGPPEGPLRGEDGLVKKREGKMSRRAKKRDKEQRALDNSDWEKRRLAAGVDPQHMMLPKRKDTDLAYRERVMEDETTLDLEKRRTSMEDRIDRDAMYAGI